MQVWKPQSPPLLLVLPALGAGEGLAVTLASASAAALAVGVFAIAFCGTSYVMGTDLCTKTGESATGGVTQGRIGTAINNPEHTPQYKYGGANGVLYASQWAACDSKLHAFQATNWNVLLTVQQSRTVLIVFTKILGKVAPIMANGILRPTILLPVLLNLTITPIHLLLCLPKQLDKILL